MVSHEHKDHSKAIQDLIKNGIDVYTSKGTAMACEVTGYRVKLLESEKATKIGSFYSASIQKHSMMQLNRLGFLIYHREIGSLLFYYR
ncbi:hypothetical protein [Crassaminicella thermophila]|uniref:hypothetical protein n=1 Tax=Crassaminicella thermophila TaxID=2599308 RepID=UPI001E3D9161|nr:hypothetical protein [Crassaminicella thermophila]